MRSMVSSTESDVAFLYRRAGFGLQPGQLAQISAGGYDAAVEQLIAGLGAAPDPTGDRLPAPQFSAGPPPAGGRSSSGGASRADAVAHNHALAADLAGLQDWWMDRMIASSTPLREKLALYWHGHFATGIPKVRDARLMYMQNQLFRSAGGGGFEELTQAVAKDGAMMLWLDTSTDKKGHPNENFAREMMELFTLGVGNYTQGDVTAGSRGFTGWAYVRSAYRYVFRRAQHDFGAKTYLGETGDWNGEDIVHIAVSRPASGRFVLASLWSHFAYPVHPTDQVVGDLLPAYGTRMDVSSAMRALFLHPAFRGPASRAGLVKQPVEYLAGAARSLGLDARLGQSSGGAAPSGSHSPSLAKLAAGLGQTLFDPPNVSGWGQNAYWLTTATSQLRLEIALVLAKRADLATLDAVPPGQRLASVAGLLCIDRWGPTTSAALARVAADPLALTALALTSPEYVLA